MSWQPGTWIVTVFLVGCATATPFDPGAGPGKDSGTGPTDGSSIDAPRDAAIDAPPDSPPTINCQAGAPSRAFRFHYEPSNLDEVQDGFGLPSAAHWNVEVTNAPPYVDAANGGGPRLRNNAMLIYFSLTGVAQITAARVHVLGGSNDGTDASFAVRVNDQPKGTSGAGSLTHNRPYTWASVDLTGALTAGADKVTLTIQPGTLSQNIVANAVELCLAN